jgi:lysyl-tRNA synthetase class 1
LLDPAADVAAEAAAFRPAFAHLALLLQIPKVDLGARVGAEKGSPLTDREQEILDERVRAARAWLETYAPENAQVSIVRDHVPELTTQLTDDMRAFLGSIADEAERDWPTSGEAWQNLIFRVAADRGMATNRRSFAAIYLAFLGRENGPRAGWLLSAEDRAFVLGRLRAVASGAPQVPA